MAEPFLFDDFFLSDSDPGVEVTIPLRGRDVPFTLKRGITLRDKEEAASAAMQRHFDESGKLVIDGLDDHILTAEILARGIKAWPFTYKDGSPVPVTRENVMALVGSGAEQLVALLTKGVAAKKEEANGPFETASAAPSADTEATAPSTPEASASASSATPSLAGDQSR